eukprot:scaffold1954_cov268-Pinguiococcus_pyrenoidosus.AAC.149
MRFPVTSTFPILPQPSEVNAVKLRLVAPKPTESRRKLPALSTCGPQQRNRVLKRRASFAASTAGYDPLLQSQDNHRAGRSITWARPRLCSPEELGAKWSVEEEIFQNVSVFFKYEMTQQDACPSDATHWASAQYWQMEAASEALEKPPPCGTSGKR